MTQTKIQHIYIDEAPGEFRAAAYNAAGRAVGVFSERWSGTGGRARCGAVVEARLKTYADTLRGAFCVLASGEEVFLRLKSRDGLTEGMALRVQVLSEARHDKLARVAGTDLPLAKASAFHSWRNDLGVRDDDALSQDSHQVAKAFDEALASSVTLPGGGRLHIDRTRALTAFDIDTAGRIDKGSAAARALAINRDAVLEMARQVSLRGLGGLLILDCVSPLNSETSGRVRDAAKQALEQVGLSGARILKPSALGLLEAAVPWRYMPVADARQENPAETELLDLLRDAQRQANASPVKFYNLSLCGRVWQAYLSRKIETDHALQTRFGGRVSVVQGLDEKNKVLPR